MPDTPAQSSPGPQSSPRAHPLGDNNINQVIEAADVVPEPETDDGDSAVGTAVSGSTESISASILEYRTIQGRRFHSEKGNALYWGSNDEYQSEAMDIIHHMWTLAQDGRLYLAPIQPDIKKALDIGCGTGIWAIDFADEFPDCKVIGTDVSPIQPSWVPPNLKFEIDDCTQEWMFTPGSYDYIHIRYLVGAIPDWNHIFQQAFKTVAPGGWVESFEASPHIESDDGTVTPDMALGQWGGIFIEGSKKTQRSFTVLDDGVQRKAMEAAGFVELQEWNFKCPLSPWAKDAKYREIGQFGELFATQDTEGFLTFVSSILGWSMEKFQVYIAHFRREIKDRRNHPYFRIKVVWGRKP